MGNPLVRMLLGSPRHWVRDDSALKLSDAARAYGWSVTTLTPR